MNFRAIIAAIAGIIIWSGLFMAAGIAVGIVWPDYSAAAALFFDSGDFSGFTVPMMLTNITLFAVAGLGSGWLVGVIGGGRTAPLILAGLGLAYGLFDHYYLAWNVLPTWYNLVVPWVLAGSIYVGARFSPEAKAQPSSEASTS